MVAEQKGGGSGDTLSGMEKDLFQRSLAREIQGLSACLALPPTSAEVIELQEYAMGVGERIEETRAIKAMPPYEANNLLGEMSEEDRKWAFANTLLRIEGETEYLEALEEVGVTSDVLAMGLDKGKYKAALWFLEPDSFFAKRLMKEGTLGLYHKSLDLALIKDKVPYDEEMWKMMATEGLLPDSVGTVIHELTHDAQAKWLDKYGPWAGLINSSSTVMNLMLKFGANPVLSIGSLAASAVWLTYALDRKKDGALGEVDAFRAENNFPGYYDESLDEPHEVAENLHRSYDYYERPIDVLIRAYDDMVVLREMGMSQANLGKLVRSAIYDPKSESYPKLEAEVDLRIGKLGVEGKNNVEIFRRGLVLRNEIEIRYQRAKAMKIAGQEMRRERGREKWPYEK